MHAATPAQAPAPGAAALPATLAEAAALRYLDPGTLLFAQAGALLRLTLAGDRSWPRVSILRAFPLSRPDAYYSVRDSAGGEIGLIRDPAQLSPDNRRLVERDLRRRYVVSTLTRVLAVEERFGTVEWSVETERGRCRFTTRDLRSTAVPTGASGYLLTDVEGNRYLIPDLRALDPRSQAWLIEHL